MKCEVFRERIFDYLAGTLPESAPFQEHAVSCPACAALLEGIEENEGLLSRARVPTAPADLWPRIAAAISSSRPVSGLRRWKAFAAAAAMALVVLGVLSSGTGAPRPSLDVAIEEAGPAFGALVPRYEDADAGNAMADALVSPFRSDY